MRVKAPDELDSEERPKERRKRAKEGSSKETRQTAKRKRRESESDSSPSRKPVKPTIPESDYDFEGLTQHDPPPAVKRELENLGASGRVLDD